MFGSFFFSSVVIVCVFMVNVSAFRFLCWLSFWYFVVLFCVFVFVLFIVSLSIYEKAVLFLQFWCFLSYVG